MKLDIGKLLTVGGALVKENAPAILTGVSIAAGGGAVVAACVGQHKADVVIAEMSDEDQKDTKAKVKATWKFYVIPAALYGVSVVTGISSYKNQASRYKALLSAYAMSSDKTEELTTEVKKKLGIEDKESKEDDKQSDNKSKEVENRVMFTEQTHWIYEPISGATFKTKLSDLYGSAVRVAEDWDNKQWVSIGDIIRNCEDVEYDTDISEAANFFGWSTEDNDVGVMIPRFEEGYMKPDGTTCIKLEFAMKPVAQSNVRLPFDV